MRKIRHMNPIKDQPLDDAGVEKHEASYDNRDFQKHRSV
jgi:hypothetical protein